MKRLSTVLALTIAFAAPASAFTMDLPTLTYPTPSEPTQSCLNPADLGTATCTATE